MAVELASGGGAREREGGDNCVNIDLLHAATLRDLGTPREEGREPYTGLPAAALSRFDHLNFHHSGF